MILSDREMDLPLRRVDQINDNTIYMIFSDKEMDLPPWRIVYMNENTIYVILSDREMDLSLRRVDLGYVLCMRQIQHFGIFWSIILLLYHLFRIGQALF